MALVPPPAAAGALDKLANQAKADAARLAGAGPAVAAGAGGPLERMVDDHFAGIHRQVTGQPAPIDDTQHRNGAEFTRTHVMRGANFLARYLPGIGLANWVPVATQVVHFTGYEVPFKDIRLDDMRDRRVGHLLGTADMLAQMSDRCYLEKCRDRLYPEFVIGGVAMQREDDGGRGDVWTEHLTLAGAEAELLLRRFTESLGDDVWTLEVEPG